MTTLGLFEELRDDPAALGYATLLAAENDQGVADLGNAYMQPVIGILNRTDLTKWAAKTGMRLVIEQEAANPASPVCSLALSIIDVLRGASGGIDFTDPDNMASLNAWVAVGKLTPTNKDLMLSMATKSTQRNVALFGRLLTANDIAWVARDAAGNKLLGV